jgi:hypothetical protein
MEDKNINKVHQPDPFISQNVWLKGVGGIILLICLLPTHKGILFTILGIVATLALFTYVVKLIKMFVKNIWNS